MIDNTISSTVDYVARHKGIVTALSHDNSTVELRLIDNAADCGGCALRGLCSPTDHTLDKNAVRVSAACLPEHAPATGDTIEVGLPDSARWFSAVVMLVVPILLFTVILLGIMACGGNELLAVVSAAGAIAIYLLILIPFRPRLARYAQWRVIDPQ